MAKIGTLVLGNIAGFPHPEGLLGLFLAVWAGSLCLALVLILMGLAPRPSFYGVFVAIFGFIFLGGVVRERGLWLTVWLLVAMVLLTVWFSSRDHLSNLVDALMVAAAVALLAGPLIAGFRAVGTYGVSTLEFPEPIESTLQTTPNIWFVVTDGYPSSATLETDLGITPSEQLSTTLREDGFVAPANTWTGYASTRLVIPSIFEMDYIATDWEDNLATTDHLYTKIAGGNQLFGLLERNGYEIHMIEAGWSGGGCGPQVDVCTDSKFYDGSMNVLVHDTLLTDLPWASPGYHFAIGNRHTMESLRDLASGDSLDSPFFVFAHLVAPHPPLFLDAGCELVVQESRKGFFYPYPGVDPVERDRLFKEQMSCVDRFLIELSVEIAEEDLLIFVSDHGPSRRAQTAQDPTEWVDAALRERMGSFLAIRSPIDCAFPEPFITVNLMRTLLSCLGDREIALLEPRLFPGSDVELDPLRVERLLEFGSGD